MPLSDDAQAVLDPSIVVLPIFWTQDSAVCEQLFLWNYRSSCVRAKERFWKGRPSGVATVRADWEPQPSRIEPNRIEGRDHELVPKERREQIDHPNILNTDVRNQDVPFEVTSRLSEQTPQFTLRNLPRVERNVDLDRAIRFDEEDMPLLQAREQIQEVRDARFPRPDFATFWSAQLLDDFRIFLEEVLYLCPWEEMPRGSQTPDEDSTWSPTHSRATLTFELIKNKRSVFVFGHGGRPMVVERTTDRKTRERDERFERMG